MKVKTEQPDSGIAKIEQHTDDLQDLANSELPCSGLAEALLSLEGSKDG